MKRAVYGVPYLGSKNTIAKDIIAALPAGKRLVDLFAGGCAITHCAMDSGKWEKVLNNDLYPLRGQTLFKKAAAGEYLKDDYCRIVGHDEFYEKRFVESHITAIWGWNFTHAYIGRPFEKFCRENDITDIRQLEGMKGIDPHYRLPLSYLKRLRNLAGLDLSKVEFAKMDYAEFRHEEGDVVYCDPPYKNTDHRYGMRFDSERFWEWVRTRDYPVYVSEYAAPSGFRVVWSRSKGTLTSPDDPKIGSKGVATRTENIYLLEKWA